MINVNYDVLGNSSKELWKEADELGNHIRRIGGTSGCLGIRKL